MNISFTYSDFYTFLLGALLMMLFYTVASYWQTRRIENLYYAIYVFCQWFYLFVMKDDILTHSPIGETWELAMSRPVAIISYNLFAISFLDLKTNFPKLYGYARWNVYIGLFLAVIMVYFCLIGQPGTARKVIDIGKIFIYILGIMVVIGMMRQGSVVSRYFVFGSFLLMGLEGINIVLNIVCHTTQGAAGLRYLAPDSLFAYPSFLSKIGIMGDLLCLTLGLSYRNQQIMLHSLQAELEKQRALENERSRIARDMHDELGSGLSALQLLSYTLQQPNTSTEEIPKTIKGNLQRIANISLDLGQRLREVIWTISIDDDNLHSLLHFTRRYAVDFCESQNLKLDFTIPVKLKNIPFSGEKRRNIFLAIKEILNNTSKYAKATSVQCSIEMKENQLIFKIKDNGAGFDYTAALQRGGQGLRNINTRMANIGGTAAYNNSANGTEIQLILAL